MHVGSAGYRYEQLVFTPGLYVLASYLFRRTFRPLGWPIRPAKLIKPSSLRVKLFPAGAVPGRLACLTSSGSLKRRRNANWVPPRAPEDLIPRMVRRWRCMWFAPPTGWMCWVGEAICRVSCWGGGRGCYGRMVHCVFGIMGCCFLLRSEIWTAVSAVEDCNLLNLCLNCKLHSLNRGRCSVKVLWF